MNGWRTIAAVAGFMMLTLATARGEGQGAFVLATKKVGTYSSKRNFDCPNHEAKSQSIAVQITVRNLAKTNASIKVEWYFVAKRADTGSMVLFGEGEMPVELTKSASTNFVVKSDVLYQHDPNCMEMNPKTDAKMVGYAVRGKSAAGDIRFEATLPSLKDILSSPVAFEKLKKDSAAWRGARPKSLL
jgi:hypothetical protein